MNRLLVILTYLVALLVSLNGLFGAAGDTAPQAQPKTQVGPAPAADADQIAPGLRGAPKMFIENVGQFDDGARFQLWGGNKTIWLAEDAIWITLLEPVPPSPEDRFAPGDEWEPADTPRRGVNLRLTFPGANPAAELIAYKPVDTTISYFLGDDSDQWRPDVPVWARVQYLNLYPGLDMVWDSAAPSGGLRLICHAADCPAALEKVRLRVEGADALALEGNALHISTAAGNLRLPLLHVADAAGEPLSPAGLNPHVQGDAITAPFSSATYPANPGSPSAPADDPGALLFSTFLGGSGEDSGRSLALDAAGNVTLTGSTYSTDFPTTPGAFDTSFNGGDTDVFVARLNAAGSALLFSTFLGAGSYEHGTGLALDSVGNTVLTGTTNSTSFPTTSGAFDTGYNGNGDVFVMRLSASGATLLYSTFLGGSESEAQTESRNNLALDAAGNAVLVGGTKSSDFPTTPGAFDTSYNGQRDAFVARLNADGSALLHSTFLGGGGTDWGTSLALDAAGNAVLTGATWSGDFPTTPGAFDTTHNAYFDVFVARLNSAGSALLQSTYIGGGISDIGSSLALDPAGNVTVTGDTNSTDFPTTPGVLETSLTGPRDLFVTRLNADASALLYSTYLGRSGEDYGYSLALDAAGNATITGFTYYQGFPTTPGAFDTSFNGSTDAFVTRLNTAGSALLYSTFLGGSGVDRGHSLVLDAAGNAVLTGSNWSSNFPTTPGTYDPHHNGDYDIFVTRLRIQQFTLYLPMTRS